VTLGSVVMAEAAIALGLDISPVWWAAILAGFYLLLLISVVRRARAGKPILKRAGDERLSAIYAKSARNALFATYLTLFIHLLVTDASALDTVWLAIMLGGGLVVLISSAVFYYYKGA